MHDNPPSGAVRHATNLLGDIGGFVAVIVAYVLAISGRSPGPIPKTTAIITVLVTTAVVWVWRARRITRREAPAILGAVAPASPGLKSMGDEHASGWLELWRNEGDPPYAMSLVRRRVELAGLLALTVGATAWTAGRIGEALPELTNLQPSAVEAFTCYPSMSSPGPRIVIADFEEAAPEYASLIENRLHDALSEDTSEDRVVCRLRQTVGTRQEAQELGKETGAFLVVWGRSDAIFDVHLELASGASTNWDHPSRQLRPLPARELADAGFALREPLRLSFLADMVLSQVLFLDNKIENARRLLGNALARAEAKELAANNPADIGEAYFLLGYMFDPNVGVEQPDAQAALAAYTRSLELNPDFHAAFLNRGKVYERLGDLDRATADYTTLVERRGNLAADGAINLAYLHIEDRDAAERDFAVAIELDPLAGHYHRGIARQDFWDDLPGALADFEAAVRLAPPDHFYYASLGEAQLLAGKVEEARQSYRDLIPRLNSDTRAEVIDRLLLVASENPHLQGAVDEIIETLRAVTLAAALSAPNASIKWSKNA